jgi:hypothetical protein
MTNPGIIISDCDFFLSLDQESLLGQIGFSLSSKKDDSI